MNDKIKSSLKSALSDLISEGCLDSEIMRELKENSHVSIFARNDSLRISLGLDEQQFYEIPDFLSIISALPQDFEDESDIKWAGDYADAFEKASKELRKKISSI